VKPGPRPKPAALRLIEGNPSKRRIPNAIEPPPVELPEPPDTLDDVGKEEWNRVAPGLHALKLLHTLDTAALAAYCAAVSTWVQARKALKTLAAQDTVTGGLLIKTTNGNAIQNPLVGTANTAARDIVRFAEQFGMTPAARTRIGAEASMAPASKWDGLVGKTRA
jgi:P27 family predicted phage terminase small subunit